MNLHTLATELADAGQHDLVEKMIANHLASLIPAVRLARHAHLVTAYDAALHSACNNWLTACDLMHSNIRSKDAREVLIQVANAELRHIELLAGHIARSGFKPTPVINPIHRLDCTDIEAKTLIATDLANANTQMLGTGVVGPETQQILSKRIQLIEELIG